MGAHEPTTTYLELRASDTEGEAAAGLSHTSEGLVLLHVLELAAAGEPMGAVTVVHDAGGHGGRYVALAAALAERGFAVALPDLRGHGRSEGERGHSNGLREVLRDLGDVQDHLAYRLPEAPKALVGHGLGGLYALAYAAERPDDVAALVLAAPLLAPRFEKPEAKGGLRGLFHKVKPSTPGRIGWSAQQLVADPDAAARAADELVHDVITLRAIEQAEGAAARYRGRLAGLPMPTLVVLGGADTIASAESVRAALGSGVELALAEGQRHDVFHGRGAPDAVARVAGWLAEHLAG
jgi:alpha-beta hydrolase superfamily lysophospholipase